MSLAGIHIVFGGTRGNDGAVLPYNAAASQTMASSAVSNPNVSSGPALLSISASAAIWYAMGKNLKLSQLTDGVTPRRYYDPTSAGGREDIFIDAGEELAWMFA